MNPNSCRVLYEIRRTYSISHAIKMTGVTAAVAAATATDANTTGSIHRTGFSDCSYNHNAFAFFCCFCCCRCFSAKINRIELSQLQCIHVNAANIQKNHCYSLVRFACPVCAIFSLDNFRNEFQLSVPLNTVPSVKMMADNDAIPVHSKAKGSETRYGWATLKHIVPLEYFKAITDRFNFTLWHHRIECNLEGESICNGHGIWCISSKFPVKISDFTLTVHTDSHFFAVHHQHILSAKNLASICFLIENYLVSHGWS